MQDAWLAKRRGGGPSNRMRGNTHRPRTTHSGSGDHASLNKNKLDFPDLPEEAKLTSLPRSKFKLKPAHARTRSSPSPTATSSAAASSAVVVELGRSVGVPFFSSAAAARPSSALFSRRLKGASGDAGAGAGVVGSKGGTQTVGMLPPRVVTRSERVGGSKTHIYNPNNSSYYNQNSRMNSISSNSNSSISSNSNNNNFITEQDRQ